MGYTHYYLVAPEFDPAAFGRVAADFKKMVAPLKHLGVVLADGWGENYPTISPTEICFNGVEKCGHEKRNLGITWPSESASGIAKNGVDTTLLEITKSTWFAGASLETRACGGDCSHEAFSLSQKLETTMERHDGSTYELEPQGEYSSLINQDGTRDRNPANDVEKYFEFTKTAYKPYDLAVTVALVIAKHHLKEQIVIRSDGNMENWHEAMQLCHHFLGYGRGFCLDEDGAEPLEPAGAEAMIAQARKNQVEIGRIKADHDGLEKEKKEKQREIQERYYATISELKRQEDLMVGSLRKEINDSETKRDKDVGELLEARSKIDRIIKLLRVEQRKLDTENQEKWSHRRDNHREIVESLTDDCIDLRLLIFENDRPKNKYTVSIAGMSKFFESHWNCGGLLELPRSCGFYIDNFGDVHGEITHLPTLDAARKYVKTRNIRKLMKDFFERYDKVHEEYQQVCQKYTLKDFAEILEEQFKGYWTHNVAWSYRDDLLKEHGIDTDDVEKMTPEQLLRLMKATGYGY